MSWPQERYATRWPSRHERPAGSLALLERVLANLPAMPDAACIGHAELFDADTVDRATDAAEALALCDRCPELDRCHRWAASQPHGRLTGVVAGAWFIPSEHKAQRGSQP
jgi:hypothetical protein